MGTGGLSWIIIGQPDLTVRIFIGQDLQRQIQSEGLPSAKNRPADLGTAKNDQGRRPDGLTNAPGPLLIVDDCENTRIRLVDRAFDRGNGRIDRNALHNLGGDAPRHGLRTNCEYDDRGPKDRFEFADNHANLLLYGWVDAIGRSKATLGEIWGIFGRSPRRFLGDEQERVAMNFRFDEFELDTDKHELRRAGSTLPVEPQIFEVLAYLIRHRERMVSKQELIDQLWDGRAVSDWTISGSIKSARVVLGDSAKTKRYIRTIHGKGYRFVGDAASPEIVEAQTGSDDPPSIAVLPFANLSGQPDQDYLSDGITEDLITDLGNIDGLTAMSRNASFAFRQTDDDVQTVSRRLNARYLLQGSVRQIGRTIRINARLVDGAKGNQLWAERFDGEQADIFALQDRINAGVIASLKLNLLSARSTRRSKGTSNSEAYDHCLRGRSEYYLYTPAHLAKAQKHFERAVICDPDYAEAYAYQSYCRTSAYVFAWPGSDATLDTAIELAQKAIALDPASAIAHARLGWVLGFVDRFDEAVDSFETAATLDPRSAEVFYAYGETMNRRADPHRALGLLKTALEIDTFVPPSWEFAKGHSHVLLHDIDGVLSNILPVLERVPRFIPARVQLARGYHDAGQVENARLIVETIREFAPRYRLMNAARMFPYPVTAELDRMISALRDAGLPE